MIDKNTGKIRFEEPPFELGPETTRSDFLASDVARQSHTIVENEPWHSWGLPRMRSGLTFAVSVYFEGERLKRVFLADADDRFGVRWEDVTAEKLQAQMESHDQWLSEYCHIEQGWHPWGSVSSIFDNKGGGCDIMIAYEAVSPLPRRIRGRRRFTPMDRAQGRLDVPDSGRWMRYLLWFVIAATSVSIATSIMSRLSVKP